MRYPLAVLSVVGLLISSLLYGQDELKPADPLAKTQNIQEQHKPERKPAANGTNKTQADTSAEKNDEQQTAEDNNDEQQNATNEKATEATDKIQVFFEELDDVMAGPAKFARIVKGLKSELKEEYQQNEKQLLGANVRPKDRSEILEGKQIKELEDRQKVIVQCYIDLTNRASSNNPRERMDLHSKIRERFREFRRENPTLASDARIGKKEQELMQQAMQRGMGFGRTTQQTLVETMRNLSANGDVAVAINALVPVESVSSLAHPGEQQGPIQEQRRGIQSILKLKWKGKNLSIDQEHWDDMFARMTVDGVHAKVDTMLQQKGAMLEEKRREHHPMHMALDATNVERLFHELRGAGGNSYSRSGSGQTVRMSFRKSSFETRMNLSPIRFELTIEELKSPGRLMRVVESEKGLDILLVGDLVHRFSSRDDGVTVIDVTHDDVLKFHAKSFADLYRQEPRFVEMRFFALLDHLGITPPASRFHPQIVSRLLEIIAMDESRLQAEVDELVVDLDADRFTTREAAYAKLLAKIGEYYDLLYAMQEDEFFSTEVAARIKKLLTTNTVKEASQLDGVISVLRLADDVEYLDELKGIVDAEQRESIERRLESLKQ